MIARPQISNLLYRLGNKTDKDSIIIFPHVPKTGGSSIRHALLKSYGYSLNLDYENPPVYGNEERQARELILQDKISKKRDKYLIKYNIIYGHFPANRYDSLGTTVKKAIFFRDPVNRTCSHYFYGLNNASLANDSSTKQTITEYSKRPFIRHFYENYLAGVEINQFDFVGITEYFDESIELFNKIFGVEIEHYKKRVGKNNNYIDYLNEENALSSLVDSQKLNQSIYDKARKRFDDLWNEYN